jgi:type I restriction enzyme S subunit
VNNRPNTCSVETLSEGEYPEDAIPDTWAWVRFGSIIGELRNGISPRPNIQPPGIPILRISATRPGGVDLADIRHMPNGEDFLSDYGLRDTDLLFTRYNGSIEFLGVCGMVRGLGRKKLLYPDKLMRVRFDHELILPAYAEIFFQVPRVHERIVAKSKSSAGQNGVSGSDIKAQPFALAPLTEQQEIVQRVERLFTLADKIGTRYKEARQRVDHLSQSILAKAFQGELVPTETELAEAEGRAYETAEQLLKRVQTVYRDGSDKRDSKRQSKSKAAVN